MTSKEAITKIKELIKPINVLSQMRHGNVEFQKWYRRVVLTLGHIYPSNKTHVKSFVSIKFTLGYYCFDQELRAQQAYVNGLESAKGFLEVLVEEIKEYGLDGCNGELENEACMHSVVASVSEKAIRAGLYADAVERAFKAINSRVKKMVQGQSAGGNEHRAVRRGDRIGKGRVRSVQEIFDRSTQGDIVHVVIVPGNGEVALTRLRLNDRERKQRLADGTVALQLLDLCGEQDFQSGAFFVRKGPDLLLDRLDVAQNGVHILQRDLRGIRIA